MEGNAAFPSTAVRWPPAIFSLPSGRPAVRRSRLCRSRPWRPGAVAAMVHRRNRKCLGDDANAAGGRGYPRPRSMVAWRGGTRAHQGGRVTWASPAVPARPARRRRCVTALAEQARTYAAESRQLQQPLGRCRLASRAWIRPTPSMGSFELGMNNPGEIDARWPGTRLRPDDRDHHQHRAAAHIGNSSNRSVA